MPDKAMHPAQLLSINNLITDTYRALPERPEEVILLLPEFTIAGQFNLKPILSQTGLDVIFTQGEANFSAISGLPNTVLEKLEQMIQVVVSEKGAKLAAITEHVGVLCAGGPSRRSVVIDKPFVCWIKDEYCYKHNKNVWTEYVLTSHFWSGWKMNKPEW